MSDQFYNNQNPVATIVNIEEQGERLILEGKKQMTAKIMNAEKEWIDKYNNIENNIAKKLEQISERTAAEIKILETESKKNLIAEKNKIDRIDDNKINLAVESIIKNIID